MFTTKINLIGNSKNYSSNYKIIFILFLFLKYRIIHIYTTIEIKTNISQNLIDNDLKI